MKPDDFELCHTIGTARLSQIFTGAPGRYAIVEPVIDGLLRELFVSVDLWNVRYHQVGVSKGPNSGSRPAEMLVGPHMEFPSLNAAITATMFVYEKGWEEI